MVFTIGDLLLQWQQFQVFDYALPFLFIFAVVFGILSATNILGSNKGIHVVIAVVAGLMALQFQLVPVFFAQIFGRLAIAIAVIVAVMILVGLFIPREHTMYWFWGLGAIGFIAAIIVVSQSFLAAGWFPTSYYSDYVGWIVGAVLVIGLIIAVATSGGCGGGGGGSGGTATFRPIRS